jgi:hypothetical protein
LKSLFQPFVAKPALRYLLGPVAAALIFGLLWSTDTFVSVEVNWWLALLGLYLLGSSLWMAAAVSDRRRLIWRLALIWIPEIFPVALVVNEIAHPDPIDSGLAIAGLMQPLILVGIAGVFATFAAWVYRPGEGGLRYPPQ